jgi:hypothetical protein
MYRLLLASVAALGVAVCEEQLLVQNDNNPDQDRALRRPTDVEGLIAGSYNTMHAGVYNFGGSIPQLLCLGMENYSNLANSAMGVRSTVPRPPVANTRNSTGSGEPFQNFLRFHRAARAAALGLNRVNQSTFTFFTTDTAALRTQIERAKAFAHFVIGISLGQVAMQFDSGAMVNENDDLSALAPLPLVDYNALAVYALQKLDSAYAHAAAFGTGTAQTIPTTWMANPATLTAAQFQGVISGWKARIRANIARSPADVVAWPTVLADANDFLAKIAAGGAFPGGDVVMSMNPAGGWDNNNMNQLYQSTSVNWHMMHPFMIGMADTSGGYLAWLNMGGGDPTSSAYLPYTIVTPDRRFPNGGAACNGAAPLPTGCRTAQQAAAGLYITNRATGIDWGGEPFGNSQYRQTRWLPWFNAARIGNYVIMARAEIRLLAAEAEYRAGNFAAAAGLVDSTRVSRGQLPGVSGVLTNATATLPGTGCTPRVPVRSGNTFTTSCATLLEALKWEKRLETMYTYMGTWYFDGRRWGDLAAGTATNFPVPYQESDARGTFNFYSLGGVGNAGGAPVGNYGF